MTIHKKVECPNIYEFAIINKIIVEHVALPNKSDFVNGYRNFQWVMSGMGYERVSIVASVMANAPHPYS